MTTTPYINFYTSDFLAGTSGMTAATKGVYITLLSLIYEAEGPLTQNWDTLARRCGSTLPAFKKAIDVLLDDEKISLANGAIWSEKCAKHLSLRRERGKSAKAAAEKRWKKSEQKQSSGDADAMRTVCYPEPEPEPYIGSSISAREQPIFREQILKAMGHDISGVTATGQFVCNPTQFFEVQRWQSDLGLSEEEIISVIENTPCQNGPPSTPKYYSQAMQRFAGEKNQPKLKSIQGGENNRKSTHNTEHLQRIINAAAEGSSKQDWG